jgi:diacylglycerol kinase (ATP)
VVVEETERMPKYFGGTIPYLGGLLRALLGYKNKAVVVNTEDAAMSGRVLNVVVANGGYMGGGMHIAPKAKVSDSLLDVVMVGDMGKFELIKEIPTVYKGTHIYHPKVRMVKAKRITISSPERLLVHADGELLGESPATFWVMPAALKLVV